MDKTRFWLYGWICLFAGLLSCSTEGWAQGQELTGKVREKNVRRIKEHVGTFYASWLGACMEEDQDFMDAIGASNTAPGGAFKPDFGASNEDGLWSFRNYCDKFRMLYRSMFEEALEFRQSDFRFISLKSTDGGNSVEADFTYRNQLFSGDRLMTTAQVEAVMILDVNSTEYKLKQILPIQDVTVHNLPEEEKLTPKAETVERPTGVTSAPESEGVINGHEYVDLGLSVKWATCNVGASGPSDYGDYFAWGEISPKSEYSKENSVTYKKNIGDIGGNARYDAARANWGGSWRLPTLDEIKELDEKCTWTWTTQGGHNGYEVVGPSGKSIFLPAAGWRGGASLYGVGEYGHYWSSSPYGSDARYACGLYFHSRNGSWDWSSRNGGRSVRPVSD